LIIFGNIDYTCAYKLFSNPELQNISTGEMFWLCMSINVKHSVSVDG